MDLGLVASYWGQVTEASGEDAAPPLLKYRVLALGAEFQWRISPKLLFKARPGGDVVSKNSSEGPFAVVEFTYLP